MQRYNLSSVYYESLRSIIKNCFSNNISNIEYYYYYYNGKPEDIFTNNAKEYRNLAKS